MQADLVCGSTEWQYFNLDSEVVFEFLKLWESL